MKRRTLAGRYELGSPIGRGGMGEVWAGYDTRLDRRVAVKLLHAHTVSSSTQRTALAKRFAREARLTARVEHPGVPAIFDAGVDAGGSDSRDADGEQLYLVMQLVPGIDLVDFLVQHQPLPVEWAVAVAAQIASILSAAHAVSLVHRDLKPTNVMLRPDGTVVVLDFGVAALLAADATRLTATGETIGSPAYMSPEQVLGGVASPRSDLYALGCILYELLADVRPFPGEASYPVMRRHVEEPAPRVRLARPDVPPELERLVLDLMAKEPEDRPADAEDVYGRLAPFLPAAGREDRAVPSDPTRPYRFPLAPRRGASRPSPRPGAAPAGEPVGSSAAPAFAAPAPVDFAAVRDEAADLVDAGRFTQAAELLTDLLARGRRARSRSDVRSVRHQLANTLLLGGDYARALTEYERLVEDIEPERAPDDQDILHWKLQIATCHAALGHAHEALAYLEPVLATKQRQFGRRDEEVIELRRQAAALHASVGDGQRAAAELRSLLTDLGPSHPMSADVATALRKLGQI
ncbi:serine/threonine-protein kinase [Actinopolymorpha rutila]|uniref:non-specific serine/threonine protein kinase n=1 Tax=Actinopolymorpha rutila TaxID=446787 RepID=A0A852ZDD3_9ACTN|nr:serine/threonine-protein kinase [Actinopolymorpha rutila]NYH87709.1 tetratricopeptide (TPR) repeat protein [Actinopolymorpha rutila]